MFPKRISGSKKFFNVAKWHCGVQGGCVLGSKDASFFLKSVVFDPKKLLKSVVFDPRKSLKSVVFEAQKSLKSVDLPMCCICRMRAIY